ncbi:MAG: prenyltransferase, partial [Phycisphaerales bacterium]
MSRTHRLLLVAGMAFACARAMGQDAPAAQPASENKPAQQGAPASPAEEPAENEITPELDAAVSRGMAALARTQKEDGSFGDIQLGRTVAITSIACLAFMADGNAPDRGPYSTQVRKGLEYVLKNCTESGLIAAPQANTPMYGHGFATLFLGEVYGM